MYYSLELREKLENIGKIAISWIGGYYIKSTFPNILM